jgi:NTE family protein
MPPLLPAPASYPAAPGMALALGGGGARGLAHILVLEVFDELGLKPARIAGTSIGALYGAAYASGLSAKIIRAHTEETLGQRFDLVRQIFAARSTPVSRLLSFVPVRSSLLDANILLDAILPSGVPRTFEQLTIPLQTIACDFYAQSEVVHCSGDLRSAVAASMALPVVFAPVTRDGRALVDGGFVNPLPFDVFPDTTGMISVAIDVSGGAPDARPHIVANIADRVAGPSTAKQPPQTPSATDVLAASSQILQRSIVREKLKARQPDILIECPVDAYSVIDFHKWREVLAASLPIKDQLKRQLDRVLRSTTVALPRH